MKHAHGWIWGNIGFLLLPCFIVTGYNYSLPIVSPHYLCKEKFKKKEMGNGVEEQTKKRET